MAPISTGTVAEICGGGWNPNFATQFMLSTPWRICEGVKWNSGLMTHRDIDNPANPHLDMTDDGFATLANQLIDDNWHLPPEGDQSWREQDALRIFSEHGKDEINDTEYDPPASTDEARERPALPRAVGILMPLSLATFVAFFAVKLSAPEMLTAGFWDTPDPKVTPVAHVLPMRIASAMPRAPVRHVSEPAPDKLRPSFDGNVQTAPDPIRMASALVTPKIDQRAGEVRMAQEGVTRKINHGAGQVLSPAKVQVAKANDVHRTSVKMAIRARPGSVPAVRVAKLKSARVPSWDEEFAAAGWPATKRSSSSTEARSKAAMDWKAEAAKWDEMASIIRARREKNQKDEDAAPARAKSENEFP